MRRAEKYIRRLIDDLFVGPGEIHIKAKIENAIEFMYYQGSISKKKRKKLTELYRNKYTELSNKYYKEQDEKYEKEFRLKMEMIYGKDGNNYIS